MPQEKLTGDDITVIYQNDLGGRITITLDGKDFVLSAARAKPAPLMRQAEEYMGTIVSSVWHHPTDVTAAVFLLGTLAGEFDWINPQASQNARTVMQLPVEALSYLLTDVDQLRLALQMLLVYQQVDLRGRMLLATATRVVTSATLSNWIFSLGGRIKRGGASRWAATFALSSIGAFTAPVCGCIERVCQ